VKAGAVLMITGWLGNTDSKPVLEFQEQNNRIPNPIYASPSAFIKTNLSGRTVDY